VCPYGPMGTLTISGSATIGSESLVGSCGLCPGLVMNDDFLMTLHDFYENSTVDKYLTREQMEDCQYSRNSRS